MIKEQLLAAWQSTPFRPFTLRMADGRSFRIEHPEFVSVSPAGRTVIVYEESDAFHVLDALLMTEVDVSASPPKRGQ